MEYFKSFYQFINESIKLHNNTAFMYIDNDTLLISDDPKIQHNELVWNYLDSNYDELYKKHKDGVLKMARKAHLDKQTFIIKLADYLNIFENIGGYIYRH